MRGIHTAELVTGSFFSSHMGKIGNSRPLSAIWSIVLFAISLLFFGGNVLAGNTHRIGMFAEEITGGYFAYRMMRHEITDQDGNSTDITTRYSDKATIPGPTLIISEGDEVEIELMYQIVPDQENSKHNQVSLHVHGVHFDIDSDGTLKYINLHSDQSATPVMSYTYRWRAAPGTAGTWPYHDHNMESHNGAEDRGLFGALIVNSASTAMDNVKKEFVLYIIDDAIVGMETNNTTGQHTPLWANPTLTAEKNSDVRFHVLALGTNFHQFQLNNYTWADPGSVNQINTKAIGPLEKHVFVVKATHSSSYMDTAFSSVLLGMKGDFVVAD
ncbi:multicopper oxidase domain-containing protein [Nitrosomonas communis]|uniref:Multicopper oxidase n=1 Tax=Nitrosomonas communis TaxID=44574 RepID=A0A1H2XQ23_9PROT|nr:multicopper oxidase domain-containing protein [Nitrosomonas communis]SDW94856.1 Multicopper oxidase [Nitrosomonas communis]